jgi:hypothetical protein
VCLLRRHPADSGTRHPDARQAIHRGSDRSVRELTGAIRAFIDGWNDRAHPFTWTKTAEQVLGNAAQHDG